jgi:hypothetical protein
VNIPVPHKRNIQTILILLLYGTSLFIGTLSTGATLESPEPSLLGYQRYDLLIITPACFQKELQPLVTHKNSVGISTRCVTLDEIYDRMYWHGRDNPEKIKYFIKTAIEEWHISYVLLVGGKIGQSSSWYCPVRYVNMENTWEPRFISDLYYADIYNSDGTFSTWDSDNDGLYGEWYYLQQAEDTNIDLHPDVAVGRLPCRSKSEVRIMVNKIIDYETTTYGKSWFYDMLIFAGDTYPESQNPLWVGNEGELYGDCAVENMTGFHAYRYYTSDGTLSRMSDVTRAFSRGAGFVYFVGHGSPRVWGNNKPDGMGFVEGLSPRNIPLLHNSGKYPVCVLSGCHDLQFDVDIFKIFDRIARRRGEAAYECLGWRLTRKIAGGSIATLGPTALGFTKEDKDSFAGGINEIEVNFFTQYGQHHHDVLGETWAAAISWYADTYPVQWDTSSVDDSWIDAQVVQSWILFGDPSLKIGGYPPS